MTDLKPCPFCKKDETADLGGIEMFHIHEDESILWYIKAHCCDMRTGKYYRQKDAIVAWNRRVDE